jgi:hypothetical protein
MQIIMMIMPPRRGATVPGYRRSVATVGRTRAGAALRLETGLATCRSRTAQDANARRARFGHACFMQTGSLQEGLLDGAPELVT